MSENREHSEDGEGAAAAEDEEGAAAAEDEAISLKFPYSFFQDVAIQFQEDNVKIGQAYTRYENYKSARTITEFFSCGGTTRDLNSDAERGFVCLADNKDEMLRAEAAEKDRVIAEFPALLTEKNNRIAELERLLEEKEELLENRIIQQVEANALTPRRAAYTQEQYEAVSKALFKEPLPDESVEKTYHGYTFRIDRRGRVQEKKTINGSIEYQTLKFPKNGSDRWIITRPPSGPVRHTITIPNLIVEAYYPCFTSQGATSEVVDGGKYHITSKKIEYIDAEKTPDEGKFGVDNIFVKPTDKVMMKYFANQQQAAAEEPPTMIL